MVEEQGESLLARLRLDTVEIRENARELGIPLEARTGENIAVPLPIRTASGDVYVLPPATIDDSPYKGLAATFFEKVRRMSRERLRSMSGEAVTSGVQPECFACWGVFSKKGA